MRTYTLAVSVVVHLIAISAMVVAPLFATGELPEPRRAIEWIEAAVHPAPALPAPPRQTPARRESNPYAAPVEAPSTIAPETGFEHVESGAAQPGEFEGGIPGSDVNGIPTDVPPPPPPPSKPIEPVRVGGSVREPQKIRSVAPVYPAIAQAAGVQGTVILEAVIGEDGRVRNLRVLRSIPLLDQAASDAVRQWQFTPTLLNGQPIPIVMTVTVTFTLHR